jgi:hypothetical protein
METTSALIFASPDIYPLAIEPHRSPAVFRALICANVLLSGKINFSEMVSGFPFNCHMKIPDAFRSLFIGALCGFDGKDCSFVFHSSGDDFVDLRYRPSQNAILLHKRGTTRGGSILQEQWESALPLHFV